MLQHFLGFSYVACIQKPNVKGLYCVIFNFRQLHEAF